MVEFDEIDNKLPFEDDYVKDHYDVWLMPWIRKRIARNQNVFGLFIGPTGSGKSYSAMELARSVDSTFNPTDRVFFDVKPFIQNIVDGNLRSGNALILDDAGVFMNSRDWQSVQNKAMSIVAQSFRYRNLITFLTVPKWSYIDAQTRGLFNIVFEATKEQGVFKIFVPMDVHKTLKNADTYLTHPRVPKPNAKIYVPITIKTVRFRMISNDTAQEYELKREVLIREKQEEVLNALEQGNKKKSEKNNKQKIITEEMKNIIIEKSHSGLSSRRIANELGISHPTVLKVLNDKK